MERIKLRAKNGKSKYEREFEDIKKQAQTLLQQAEKIDIRIEKMKLEKQLSLIQKEFREKEENLFLSGMRIDAEAEKQIDEFLQGEKLTARTTRQFILEIKNGGQI